MRKTLDQIMREHPLLQTYLLLGGTYHFDSRDIVLNTPGHEEYTMPANMDQFGYIVKAHIDYMEEQLQRQHYYEQGLTRETD